MTSWTEEELRLLRRAQCEAPNWESEAEYVAKRAAELLAARAGTMTADHLEHTLTNIGSPMTTGEGLRAHIAAQGARIASLEAELAETRATIARLTTAGQILSEYADRTISEHGAAQPDPQQQWMLEHPEEVAKHRGRLVAVHATRGIIRSSESYEDLVSWLDAQKVPDTEVVIDFIRETRWSRR